MSVSEAHEETAGRRAQRVAETRRRIVEATADLHASVGPPRTSISAIAERAGVQRHTVYAHFPEEGELFKACSAHWRASNPFPDPGAWAAIADPGERLVTALRHVYAFYDRKGAELAMIFDGADGLPLMAPFVAARDQAQANMARLLARGRRARGRRRACLLAAIRHALALDTWRSLVERGGMSSAEAAHLMAALADAAEAPSAGGPP